MRNLESISSKVDATVPKINLFIDKSIAWEKNINGSFDSIKNTYLQMDNTMQNMAYSFSKAQRDFSVMSRNLDNTLLESQNVMIDLQNTLQEFEQNPANIFYKKTEQKSAPGER